jgi:acetyl esterase/lipase
VRRLPFVAAACALTMTALAGGAAAGSGNGPAAAATAAAASSMRPLAPNEQVTLTYCNHEKARITEPPHPSSPAPAAVYVHGGSWVSGNFNTGGFLISQIGSDLASKGFVVVSLDYRLGPKNRWPDQIEDVKCAIRFIRAHARALHVDPDEIGAWGQSAGGNLVGLLGTAGPSVGWDVGPYTDESSKVEAVVDMAGPSDLLTLGNQGDSPLVMRSFISLLGPVRPDQIRAEMKAASPVTYVAPGDPPFLILHSDNDRIVYPQQSQELAWDMAANDVPHRLVIVAGAGHEFDQAGGSPDQDQITTLVVEYFIEMLVFHN